jgi:S-adenosyl-L-methionine hydrolase (adenosine-forming)
LKSNCKIAIVQLSAVKFFGEHPGMGLVTLLTDFGRSDSYVGVMKGVIYGICPQAIVVDLTHDVRPQDVAGGRFQLGMAVPYFPPGTIHVAVVDPGVGTGRRSIAIETDRSWLVGPDNGLLVLADEIRSAVVLDRPEFWRSAIASGTFHGRDVFAPVAAHLLDGVPLAALGTAIDPAGLVRLTAIPNSIQAIDHFGNGITNILGTALGLQVRVRNQVLRSVQTYGEAEEGEAIALVGSHGFIEIAVNGGDAQRRLGLQVGDRVEICQGEFREGRD